MVYQLRLKNSLGTIYQKIQPKISHNQLIYQFLRKFKQQISRNQDLQEL